MDARLFVLAQVLTIVSLPSVSSAQSAAAGSEAARRQAVRESNELVDSMFRKQAAQQEAARQHEAREVAGIVRQQRLKAAAAEVERQEKEGAAAALKAEQAKVAEVNDSHDAKLAADPKISAIAWTAPYCAALERQKEALAAIKEEKSYARRAGVANLSVLEEEKDNLKESERELADLKAGMRTLKIKPVACSTPEVKMWIACREEPVLPSFGPFMGDDSCLGDTPQRVKRLVQMVVYEESQ